LGTICYATGAGLPQVREMGIVVHFGGACLCICRYCYSIGGILIPIIFALLTEESW